MEAYEAPKLVELGSVADLTEEATGGEYTDAMLPAGTHFSDITFSANH